jgi:hypothetical protein
MAAFIVDSVSCFDSANIALFFEIVCNFIKEKIAYKIKIVFKGRIDLFEYDCFLNKCHGILIECRCKSKRLIDILHNPNDLLLCWLILVGGLGDDDAIVNVEGVPPF